MTRGYSVTHYRERQKAVALLEERLGEYHSDSVSHMTYIHTARLCKVCRFADNVTAPSTHTIVREGLN